jgi:hypothetical protein
MGLNHTTHRIVSIMSVVISIPNTRSAMVYPEITRQQGFSWSEHTRFPAYKTVMPYGGFCGPYMGPDLSGYLLFASVEKRVVIDTYMEEGINIAPHMIAIELMRRWNALSLAVQSSWLIKSMSEHSRVMGREFENRGVRSEASISEMW